MAPGGACRGSGGSCRDGMRLAWGWRLWDLRAGHPGHSSQRDVAAQGPDMGTVPLGPRRSRTLGEAYLASASFLRAACCHQGLAPLSWPLGFSLGWCHPFRYYYFFSGVNQ